MTWHTVLVPAGDLDHILLDIRRKGGLVTHRFPSAGGYTTVER